MRSDRNPYFLYKNHKDPKVRALLDQSPHMTVDEIQALSCKPDLKKAMRFVKQFGTPYKSVSTHQLIADHMNIQVVTPQLPQGEIYVYEGPDLHVKIRTRGTMKHSWHMTQDVFLYVNHMIWLNHTWCDVTPELWPYSRKLCDGDLHTFNQILHNHVNQKHATR
jgi:hypothetical protein